MVFKFTIDTFIDKYIPQNQIKKLPKTLGYFLGANSNSTKPRPDYLIWLEILIGSFCGILLLEGVFRSPNVFTDHHHAPLVIASYGATAILCFNANQAPLAQPRNVIVGHFCSALIGVCIEKLFSLSQGGRDHYYLGGALSVGLASVTMSILNCVHPPAGASALLPLIDEGIRRMSWWYLPTHIVSSVLIVAVSCITGNVIRRYPVYWWTPTNVSNNKGPAADSPPSAPKIQLVSVSADDIVIPPSLHLNEEQLELLETIQSKLTTATKESV